ncbi:MAG: histidinol dehydrogenase, partial [Microbacteriaceae bacterium]|nr:histidinol dehydrogenase [Microbacteriaceae bacterium]
MGNEIRVLDLRDQKITRELVATELPRASIDVSQAAESIKPLLVEIQREGAKALVRVAKAIDGIDIEPIKVSAQELAQALEGLDSELRTSIEVAIDRVRRVSQANMPSNTSVSLAEGANVSQRWQPVESVGLYVPGGKAVYP